MEKNGACRVHGPSWPGDTSGVTPSGVPFAPMWCETSQLGCVEGETFIFSLNTHAFVHDVDKLYCPEIIRPQSRPDGLVRVWVNSNKVRALSLRRTRGGTDVA